MIHFILRTYDTTNLTARRDADFKRREITSRIQMASWSYSLRQPYEQAVLRTTIRIDELDTLGLGTSIQGTNTLGLHCSGWLEIYDEDVRVFFGLISGIRTGLKLGKHGERISQGVEITVMSWVSLLFRPFRLTSRLDLIQNVGLYSYEGWARVFESVFSTGAAVDVAQGFADAWEALAQFKTPTNEWLFDFPVAHSLERLKTLGIEDRSLTRVVGANLSQVPTNTKGSLWSTFLQTFQPTPELIELFPTWDAGQPYIMYRMKPLAPNDANRINEPTEYFNRNDVLECDDNNLKVQIRAHTVEQYQPIERILAYSLSYNDQRNNYIEVSSSYLGVSQLAGLNSAPIALLDDIQRYGLHPLEITYSLLRQEKNAPQIIEQLEELTRYAGALYSEGHAFATGSIDTMYQPQIHVGEWARWYDYSEGEGNTYTGYVTSVTHDLSIDGHGAQHLKSRISVERVSVLGRRSTKKLVNEYPIPVMINVIDTPTYTQDALIDEGE